jgi:hydroxyacylglutathione hydrolase
MVDFGTTGPAALRTIAGLQPTDIEAIVPTHCHADHAGGIEMMALMGRYISKRKPNMIIEPTLADELWHNTLKGGCEKNECRQRDGYLTMDDYFNVVHPVAMQGRARPTFKLNVFQNHMKGAVKPIRVELFRTRHVPIEAMGWWDSMVSYGLLIDDRIFFSGDAQFEPDHIIDYASRSEWMFQDTSLHVKGSHATLEELKTLPDEVKKKMFNVHYGDNFRQFDNSDFAGWTQQGVRYIFD